MRTSKDIRAKEKALSEQEIKTLQEVKEEITMILEIKKVNEEILTKLSNVITTMSTLKDNYMWRILRAAKQNHMLD